MALGQFQRFRIFFFVLWIKLYFYFVIRGNYRFVDFKFIFVK